MKFRYRLGAFSIMELVIALLLSGILMGIGYYGYEIFTEQYRNKKMEIELIEDIGRFTKQIHRDFLNAKMISGNKNAIRITNLEMQVSYEFEGNYICRHSEVRDTFFVVSEPPIVQVIATDNHEGMLVESLTINIKMNDEILPLFVKKNYPLDVTIKHE